MADKSSDAAVCPVDHKTRDLWLAQARAKAEADGQTLAHATSPHASPPSPPPPSATPTTSPPARTWWPSFWSSTPPPAPTASAPSPRQPGLDTHRVVSSIPRTTTDEVVGAVCPVPHTAAAATPAAATPATSAPPCPVNHEIETGADPVSGHWVYPSEKMFFDAMRRKGNEGARAADVRVVVPIHNAVNERAWQDILAWEAPYAGPGRACGGPRLHSFAGLSTNMSPRARLYTLLGYTAPFDRHDWVVDRCGTRVDYVIDFYAGRPDAKAAGQISFYLDVRPKLNTWEGVRMRMLRAVGMA